MRLLSALASFALLMMSLGCDRPVTSVSAKLTATQWTQGGNPDHGRAAIRYYGCHTCHTIPGIAGANATVGPPLTQMAHRSFIAGELPNSPENLIHWIEHPHSVEPKTAMPEMGVTDQDAKDIAAYLYTLR